MPSDRPKIVIYSDNMTIKKLQYLANKDKRKVSNYCDMVLQKHIQAYESEHGQIIEMEK